VVCHTACVLYTGKLTAFSVNRFLFVCVINRECSKETKFLSCLWLFGSLLKTEHMGTLSRGITSQQRSGGHAAAMCARSSSLRARRCAARRQRSCVRRPDTSSSVAGVARARGRGAVTQSCRASIVRRTAKTRRPARPLGRQRCSESRGDTLGVGRIDWCLFSEPGSAI